MGCILGHFRDTPSQRGIALEEWMDMQKRSILFMLEAKVRSISPDLEFAIGIPCDVRGGFNFYFCFSRQQEKPHPIQVPIDKHHVDMSQYLSSSPSLIDLNQRSLYSKTPLSPLHTPSNQLIYPYPQSPPSQSHSTQPSGSTSQIHPTQSLQLPLTS